MWWTGHTFSIGSFLSQVCCPAMLAGLKSSGPDNIVISLMFLQISFNFHFLRGRERGQRHLLSRLTAPSTDQTNFVSNCGQLPEKASFTENVAVSQLLQKSWEWSHLREESTPARRVGRNRLQTASSGWGLWRKPNRNSCCTIVKLAQRTGNMICLCPSYCVLLLSGCEYSQSRSHPALNALVSPSFLLSLSIHIIWLPLNTNQNNAVQSPVWLHHQNSCKQTFVSFKSFFICVPLKW